MLSGFWTDPSDVLLEAALQASKREVSAILSADGYSDLHL
jgi:hypothetical protein